MEMSKKDILIKELLTKKLDGGKDSPCKVVCLGCLGCENHCNEPICNCCKSCYDDDDDWSGCTTIDP